MKIFTKMAAVVLACVLAVPGEARVNVVYQRQDSLRIVGLLQQARAMKKKPHSPWLLPEQPARKPARQLPFS